MRRLSERFAILALCMVLLTTFSLPMTAFAAGSGAGMTKTSQKKAAKKPKSEEEAALQRAENTGVGKAADGQDKVTAEQSKQKEQDDKKNVTVSTFETSGSDVDIEAKGAIIYCGDTGEVLYGKNQDKAFDPLSMTKIMTALLVMKRIETGALSMDDYAVCTPEDTKVMEVKMYLKAGERMKIRDLLYAALLESDNDAAAILGSHLGGSKAGFAALMNEQAKWLGCKNTYFTNANGLIEGNLHSTPYDMALIAREAFKYDEIRKICQTRKYKMPSTKLRPGGWTAELTNPFFTAHKKDKTPFKTYNIQGGKTGTWDYSNASLLEVANLNGHEIITVVMKAPLNKRYMNTRRLLNYANTVFRERDAMERAAAVRVQKAEEKLNTPSKNQYVREIDKSPVARQFFGFVNGIFRESCVELKDAYKTRSGEVALKWEKRPGADGYVVFRSVDGGEYVKVNNTESGDVIRFRDETVEKNHVYKYFVRAYRGENLWPCL